MTDSTSDRGNKQIIYFLFGFLIFFAFSFSIGVIVGKQIGRSMDRSLDDVSKSIDTESDTGNGITMGGQENFLVGKSETINGNDTHTENQGSLNQDEKASEVSSEIEGIKTDEFTPKSTDSLSTEIDDNAVVTETVEVSPTPSQSEGQIASSTEKVDDRRRKLTSLPPVDPDGQYTVQVGSFLEEKAARQFLNSLQLKRYPAFVKRVVIPGYGASYRVRIGTFATKDKANIYGESLKRLEPNIRSVYITINN